jgi:chromosome segregation ATPase
LTLSQHGVSATDLTSELAGLRVDNARLRQQVDLLRDQLHAMDEEAALKALESESSRRRIEQLEAAIVQKLALAERDVAPAKQVAVAPPVSVSGDIEDVCRQLREHQEKAKLLLKQREQWKGRYSRLRQAVDGLRGSLDGRLVVDLRTDVQQLKGIVRKAVDDSEQCMAALSRAVIRLQKNAATELASAVDAARADLNAQLQSVEVNKLATERQHGEVVAKLASPMASITDLHVRLTSTLAEKQALEQQRDEALSTLSAYNDSSNAQSLSAEAEQQAVEKQHHEALASFALEANARLKAAEEEKVALEQQHAITMAELAASTAACKEANLRVRSMDEEKQMWENQYRAMAERVALLESSVNNLTAEKQQTLLDFEAQHNQTRAELAAALAACDSANKHLVALEAERQAMKQQHLNAMSELEAACSRLKLTEAAKQESDRAYVESLDLVNAKLIEMETERAVLLERLSTQEVHASSRLGDLQTEKQAIEEQLSAYMHSTETSLNAIIAEKQALQNQLDEAVAKATDYENAAISSINQLQAEKQSLEEQLKSAVFELVALKESPNSSVYSLVTDRLAVEAQNKEDVVVIAADEAVASAQLETVEVENEILKQQLAKSNNELLMDQNTVATDQEAGEKHHADVVAQLALALASCEELNSKLQLMEVDKRTLEQQYSDALGQLTAFEDIAESKLRALAADRQLLESEKQVLESDKQALVNNKLQLESDREALESARLTLENDRRVFDSEKHTVESDKLTLQDEKIKLESERQTLESDRQAVKGDRLHVINENQALTSKKQGIEDEKRRLESERCALESDRQTLESEKQLLESKLQLLESEKQLLESAKQLLESNKQDLEIAKQALENEKVKLENAKQALSDEKHVIQSNRQALDVDMQALERQYREAMVRQADDHKLMLAAREDVARQLRVEVDGLNLELEQAREKCERVARSSREASELREVNSRLLNRLDEMEASAAAHRQSKLELEAVDSICDDAHMTALLSPRAYSTQLTYDSGDVMTSDDVLDAGHLTADQHASPSEESHELSELSSTAVQQQKAEDWRNLQQQVLEVEAINAEMSARLEVAKADREVMCGEIKSLETQLQKVKLLAKQKMEKLNSRIKELEAEKQSMVVDYEKLLADASAAKPQEIVAPVCSPVVGNESIVSGGESENSTQAAASVVEDKLAELVTENDELKGELECKEEALRLLSSDLKSIRETNAKQTNSETAELKAERDKLSADMAELSWKVQETDAAFRGACSSRDRAESQVALLKQEISDLRAESTLMKLELERLAPELHPPGPRPQTTLQKLEQSLQQAMFQLDVTRRERDRAAEICEELRRDLAEAKAACTPLSSENGVTSESLLQSSEENVMGAKSNEDPTHGDSEFSMPYHRLDSGDNELCEVFIDDHGTAEDTLNTMMKVVATSAVLQPVEGSQLDVDLMAAAEQKSEIQTAAEELPMSSTEVVATLVEAKSETDAVTSAFKSMSVTEAIAVLGEPKLVLESAAMAEMSLPVIETATSTGLSDLLPHSDKNFSELLAKFEESENARLKLVSLCSNLNRDISHMMDKLAEMSAVEESLRTVCSGLEERCQSLTTELKAASQTSDEASKREEHLKAEIEKLYAELHAAEQKNADLEGRVSAMDESTVELQETIERLNDKLKESIERAELLANENEVQRMTYEQKAREIRERHEQVSEDLREKLRLLLHERETAEVRFQAEKTKLTNDCQQYQSNIDELYSRHEQQLKQLRKEHEHSVAEMLSSQDRAVNASEERVEEFRRDCEGYKSALAAERENCSELKKQLTSVQREAEQLCEEHARETSELRQKVVLLEESLEGIEESRVAERAEIERIHLELEHAHCYSEAMLMEIETLKDERLRLKQDTERLEDIVHERNEECTQLGQLVDKLRQQINNDAEQWKREEAESRAYYQEAIATLEAKFREQLNEHVAEIARLSEWKECSETNLRAECDKLAAELAVQHDKHTSECQKLNEQVAELHAQLDSELIKHAADIEMANRLANERRDHELSALVDKHREDMREFETRQASLYNVTLQAELEKLNVSHAAQLQALHDDFSRDKFNEAEVVRQELSVKHRDDLQVTVDGLREKHACDMEALVSQLKEKDEVKVVELEMLQRNLTEKHCQELQMLEERLSEQHRSETAVLTVQLDDRQKLNAESIQLACAEKHRQELQSFEELLKEQHRGEMELLMVQLEETQKSAEGKTLKIEELESLQRDLVSQHVVEITAVEERLNEQHQSDVEALLVQLEERQKFADSQKLKVEELESIQQDIISKHQAMQEQLNEQHQSEMEALKMQLEESRKSVKMQMSVIEELENRLSQHECELQAVEERLNEQHRSEQEALMVQLKENQSKVNELEALQLGLVDKHKLEVQVLQDQSGEKHRMEAEVLCARVKELEVLLLQHQQELHDHMTDKQKLQMELENRLQLKEETNRGSQYFAREKEVLDDKIMKLEKEVGALVQQLNERVLTLETHIVHYQAQQSVTSDFRRKSLDGSSELFEEQVRQLQSQIKLVELQLAERTELAASELREQEAKLSESHRQETLRLQEQVEQLRKQLTKQKAREVSELKKRQEAANGLEEEVKRLRAEIVELRRQPAFAQQFSNDGVPVNGHGQQSEVVVQVIEQLAQPLQLVNEETGASPPEVVPGAEDVDSMQVELELKNTKLQSLQAELDTSNEKVALLQAELDASNEKVALLQAELDASNEKVALLQAELDASNEKVALLQAELDASNEKVALLQAELDASNEKFALLQAELDASNEKFALLQAELDARNEKVALLQAELKRSSDAFDTHTAELTTLHSEQVRRLEQALNQVQGELDISNNTTAVLQVELESSIKAVTALQEESSLKSEQAKVELPYNRDEALQKLEEPHELNNAHSEHILQLQREIERQQAESEVHRENLESFQVELGRLKTSLHAQAMELNNARESLESEQKDRLAENAAHLEALQALQNAIVHRDQLLDRLKTEHDSELSLQREMYEVLKAEKIQELENVKMRHKDELVALQRETFEVIEKEKEQYQNKLQQLAGEQAETERQMSAERQSYRSELQHLRDQLTSNSNEKSVEYETLCCKLEQLRGQLTTLTGESSNEREQHYRDMLDLHRNIAGLKDALVEAKESHAAELKNRLGEFVALQEALNNERELYSRELAQLLEKLTDLEVCIGVCVF